jgi:hypothetical protein
MKRSMRFLAAVLFLAAITDPSISAQATSGQGYLVGPGAASIFGLTQSEWLIDSGNTVYVWQFVLPVSWTIRTASYTTSNSLPYPAYPLGFGIYSYAGSKLLDVYFDTTATYGDTPVTMTFAGVTLSAGVYYFAQAQPASGIAGPALPLSNGGSTPLTSLLALLNNPAYTLSTSPIAGTAANPMSSGVLPATLGTISPLTDSYIAPAAVIWTP